MGVGPPLSIKQAARAMKEAKKSVAGVVDIANERSSRIIASRAIGNLAGQPVPNRPGVIGVRSGKGAAGVELKRSLFPWAAGMEWGAKGYPQFKKWIGGQKTISVSRPGGYVISAAIATSINQLEFVYTRGMTDGFKRWLDR